MFGSKKGDKTTGKRRLWPWGKQSVSSEDEVAVVADEVETAEDEESSVLTKIVAEVAVSDLTDIASTPDHGRVSDSVQAVDAGIVTELKSDVTRPYLAGKEDQANQDEHESSLVMTNVQDRKKEGGLFSRIKQGLSKTRSNLVDGVTTLLIGRREIDDELLEELETHLLMADVGVEATRHITDNLARSLKYKELDDTDALLTALRSELSALLTPVNRPLIIPESKTPFVILVVGVNGVGKTTTIGKLARRYQKEGKRVLLAAGDTFRAAAVEQLQIWGQRHDIPVISQPTGSDSASVLFDAFQAAKARGSDVLIADTAGRLHNKDHLMEELKKVKRVLKRLDPAAPHESLLILDAGTGQNALNQVRLFNDAIGLNGIALTKLDGTAKGGVIFALSKQVGLPIRFLGVGESVDDLRPFDSEEFVQALFSEIQV